MKKAICNVLKIVGIGSILLGLFSCDLLSDNGNFYTLKPVSDARTLPYQFVIKQELHFISDLGQIYQEERVPLDLYNDKIVRMYAVQSGWSSDSEITSIAFYDGTNAVHPITQRNFKATNVSSHLSCDIDGDDTLEVLFAYALRDTIWLNIISPITENIPKYLVIACEDRDNNGFWDGRMRICDVADINSDGSLDVLISIDAGYDLLPRNVICLDLKSGRLLWDFDVSGLVHREYCRAVRFSESEPFSIICGITSKGNMVETEYMDDEHSYIIVLNKDGSLRWLRQTGEVWTTSYFVTGDYDKDNSIDIISAQRLKLESSTDSSKKSEKAVFCVYDKNGQLIDSVSAGENRSFRKFWRTDMNQDGQPEYIAAFTDTTIVIYNHRFDILTECKLYTIGYPVACDDFIGKGTNQFLVSTDDDKTWLLDKDFAPLAQTNKTLSSYLFHTYPMNDGAGKNIIAAVDQKTAAYHLSIQQTPWFSVFFRKPWLASVVAAIPLILILGLVILYTLRIRQKNRLINKAKDELAATQDKLIEAERYAQAKDIAGGFAHEIRNALFPARSWLNRLKKSAHGSQDQSEQVSMVNQAVARAIDVTSMISQYTKLESEQNNERTNISRILNDVVKGNSLRIEEQRVKLEISCPKDVQALISRNHLYIVINNLLLNSLDALADKNENNQIDVKCSEELDLIVLTVEDNGPGIAENDIGRIFDTFYSTKPTTGIGLGLAMAKKIIKMYNGSIDVFSQPGIGARFTVKLKCGDDFDVSSSM